MKLQSIVSWVMVWSMGLVGWGRSGTAEEAMAEYERQERAESARRAKDPGWRAEWKERRVLKVGEGKKAGYVANFCVGADGNLLVCWSADDEARTAAGSEVRVLTPEGRLVKAVALPVRPGAICVDAKGNWLVGGGGKLMKFDGQGQEMLVVDSPVVKEPVVMSKEMEEMLKEAGVTGKQEMERYQRNLAERAGEVTGIAASGEDVFVACPSTSDFGYAVYRMDSSFGAAKKVAEKLRGCCGQMDIQARDGKLWVAHNARHRVECRDREGKEVSKFGKEGRVKAEHFGGCCEPKNLRVLASGEILAAESGPPTCVKRFSAEGKFLGVVALVEGDSGCVRVTVDSSPDGKSIYLLDTDSNSIRVFAGEGGA